MYRKEGGLAGSKYSFGTNERFQREARQLGDAAELPGPGSYSADTTLGTQRSSRLVTQPAFGFGSSNREQSARVFVSEFHSKSSSSGDYSKSPGPGVYALSSSIGSQASTRGRTAPTWGFGKASRFKDNIFDNGTPGPGAYAI